MVLVTFTLLDDVSLEPFVNMQTQLGVTRKSTDSQGRVTYEVGKYHCVTLFHPKVGTESKMSYRGVLFYGFSFHFCAGDTDEEHIVYVHRVPGEEDKELEEEKLKISPVLFFGLFLLVLAFAGKKD